MQFERSLRKLFVSCFYTCSISCMSVCVELPLAVDKRVAHRGYQLHSVLSDRFHPNMTALIYYRRSVSPIIRPSFQPNFCLPLAFDSWVPDAFSSPPACSRPHSISHCPYYLWDEGPSAKAVRSRKKTTKDVKECPLRCQNERRNT